MLRNGLSDEEVQRLEEQMGQRGKRSFNELVTLIVSSTVLREYEQHFAIQAGEYERKLEIQKLGTVTK